MIQAEAAVGAAFGVANTMTMAILERIREIGLMKAVGATDRDALTVFLIEAALVGLTGGAAGVGVSLLIQNVINEAVRNAPVDQGTGIIFLPVDTSQRRWRTRHHPNGIGVVRTPTGDGGWHLRRLLSRPACRPNDHRRGTQDGVTMLVVSLLRLIRG